MFLLAYFLIFCISHFPSTISLLSSNCEAAKEKAVYDYIVIGSGPGGTTIATRLALNNFKVLLIEAGPDYDDILTRTPTLWPGTQLNSKITAHFEPYLFSKEDDIQIDYPRGLTLGGSAQINAMIMVMANPSEWDYIGQLSNDSNWNYENIKTKYQPLVENCEYCSANNQGGWLNISVSNSHSFSSSVFDTNPVLDDLLTAVDTQLEFNPDVNKNNTYDSYFFTPKSVSQSTGIRSGTYRRIKDVQSIKRSNFAVWTDSFVTELIIDPETKDACGVEYVMGSYLYKASPKAPFLFNTNSKYSEKFSIYAKREIIVSGGQWMSPQLLQLSGIGDRNLLNQFGIETIQHLPGVGKNHQDRKEIPYIIKLKQNPNLPGSINFKCIFGELISEDCLIKSMNGTTNEFSTSNNILFSILRSAQPIVSNIPDSALFFTAIRFTGFRKHWILKTLPYILGSYLSVNINFARTEDNLGTVRIKSTNAFDTPLIELNHFKGENKQKEINQIIEHIRFLRKLFFETEFSKYVDYEDLPGSDLTTDEQLTKHIYEYVWGHHACCTNKIGNTETDPLAVVNSKGQVKGIKNLRVADISIFPKIPGYFPMVPIAIAAEKIADDIIKQARQ